MKNGSSYERELKRLLENKGWHVARSAGSMGEGDLIAFKINRMRAITGSYSYRNTVIGIDDTFQWFNPVAVMIIECKTVNSNAFYISKTKKNREQYEKLMKLAEEGFDVFYAIRYKGSKAWHFFRLPHEPIFRADDENGWVVK